MLTNKILVEIYFPVGGYTYDVFLPADSSVREVIRLMEHVMQELTFGEERPLKEGSLLCCRDTGEALPQNVTVSQAGIHNGTRLMLI